MKIRLRAVAACLTSAMLLSVPGSASAQTTIITDQGKEYVGDVIDAGVNTLTLRLGGSGYQIVPVKSIERIKIDIADSAPIEGQLIDWSDGELVVRVGDRDVGVRDGIVTSVIDVGVAAGGPQLSAPPQPVDDERPPAAESPDPASVPTNATM